MKTIVMDNMNIMIRDECPTLEFLQKCVRGYIEVVRLQDGGQMIINEEGKLRGMAFNEHATLVNISIGYGDVIVGPAVFLYEDARLQ